MGFIILIVIGCMVVVLFKTMNGSDNKRGDYSNECGDVVYKIPRNRLLKLLGWTDAPRRYFIGEHSIQLDVLKGYTYKPIVGTFYREDVTIFDVGWFNGYAVVEPTNQHDEFAVAIYRDDHKQLGYIPKGDSAMFNYIRSQGGYVHAYGALAYDCWSDRWYGFVAIEADAQAVKYRNAFFENKNITFYEPTINITEFLNEKQNKL